MVLPVAGGALAAWSAGRLADRVAPGAGWLGISLAGLATPMLIFSTLFYEHAAAAGLFSAGLLLMPLDGRLRSGRDWLLAGLCFGLAIAWRNETCIYLASTLGAWLVVARGRGWRNLLALVLGLGCVLIPSAAYNWLFAGGVTARSAPFVGWDGRAVQNIDRYTPQLPADFLVGVREYGLDLPEPVRWAPAAGLVLLTAAWLPAVRRPRPLRLLGLLLVG